MDLLDASKVTVPYPHGCTKGILVERSMYIVLVIMRGIVEGMICMYISGNLVMFLICKNITGSSCRRGTQN
jgi:hypothetical protein